jgi:hypothetical protein
MPIIIAIFPTTMFKRPAHLAIFDELHASPVQKTRPDIARWIEESCSPRPSKRRHVGSASQSTNSRTYKQLTMADNAQRDNVVDRRQTLRKRPHSLTKPSSPPKKQALTKKPLDAQCTTVPFSDSIPLTTFPPTASISSSLQPAQSRAHGRLQVPSNPTATQEDQLALSTTSNESDDLEDLESMLILASLQILIVACTVQVKTVFSCDLPMPLSKRDRL